ncbi:hypothetical protein LTR08_009080 [Meristemomyces frigidus]|nr:hypothetical protein LTR08_009080 [Meristemomyces frigidus]
MAPTAPNPPSHPHPSQTLPALPPTTAHEKLTHFLHLSQTNPHLHPDAQLSTSGIAFSAQTGPSGGLVMHHLTRIAQGLAGENLLALSGDELARFGVGLADDIGVGGEVAGDDKRVDGVIESKQRAGGLKRQRSTGHGEISQWADDTATTSYAEGADDGQAEWQDPDIYAHDQRPMRGEIGARSLAAVVRQNGAPPAIAHVDDHDEHLMYLDTENLPSARAFEEDAKAVRKALKQAKRSGERKELAARAKG